MQVYFFVACMGSSVTSVAVCSRNVSKNVHFGKNLLVDLTDKLNLAGVIYLH